MVGNQPGQVAAGPSFPGRRLATLLMIVSDVLSLDQNVCESLVVTNPLVGT